MEAEEYLVNHCIKKKVWRGLEKEKHQERFRTICKHLKGESFIDVGCGLGHSTMYLNRFKNGDWSGMEFYLPAVKKASCFLIICFIMEKSSISFYLPEGRNSIPSSAQKSSSMSKTISCLSMDCYRSQRKC